MTVREQQPAKTFEPIVRSRLRRSSAVERLRLADRPRREHFAPRRIVRLLLQIAAGPFSWAVHPVFCPTAWKSASGHGDHFQPSTARADDRRRFPRANIAPVAQG